MIRVLLVTVFLWATLYSAVPRVLVPLMGGVRWSDWPEKSRGNAVFYATCSWGGIVVALLFHEVMGRFAEGWEAIVCSMAAWIWIKRVTMPFLDTHDIKLLWSDCEVDGCADERVGPNRRGVGGVGG